MGDLIIATLQSLSSFIPMLQPLVTRFLLPFALFNVWFFYIRLYINVDIFCFVFSINPKVRFFFIIQIAAYSVSCRKYCYNLDKQVRQGVKYFEWIICFVFSIILWISESISIGQLIIDAFFGWEPALRWWIQVFCNQYILML